MTESIPVERFERLRRFAIAWSVACIAIGAIAAWQVLRLEEGANALDGAGRGLQGTASSLHELEDLPLVGEQVADAADTVERGSDVARSSSSEVRSSIRSMAILVGLATALLPTIPLIAITYLLRPR